MYFAPSPVFGIKEKREVLNLVGLFGLVGLVGRGGVPVGGVFPSSFEKIAALFGGDGLVELFQDLQHVFPNFAFLGEGLIAEQIRGMKGRHEGDAAELLKSPAQFADGFGLSKQAFNSRGPQGDEDFRPD